MRGVTMAPTPPLRRVPLHPPCGLGGGLGWPTHPPVGWGGSWGFSPIVPEWGLKVPP